MCSFQREGASSVRLVGVHKSTPVVINVIFLRFFLPLHMIALAIPTIGDCGYDSCCHVQYNNHFYDYLR